MGVKGLWPFVRKSVQSYNDRVHVTSEFPEPRVIIDGNSFCYFLLDELRQPLNSDNEVYRLSLEYAHKFQRANVRVVVIFDGPRDCLRRKLRSERMQNQINDATAYFNKLAGGSANPHRPKSILPIFAIDACAEAFREAGADVRFAEAEADASIVFAARTLDQVVAVLSNDSDFMIHDIPGLIPFWLLGFADDDGSMLGPVIRPAKVAAGLGIPPESLPVFGALSGNDEMPDDALELVSRHLLIFASQSAGAVSAKRGKKKSKTKSGSATASSSGSTTSGSAALGVNAQITSKFLRSLVSSAPEELVDELAKYKQNKRDKMSETLRDYMIQSLTQAMDVYRVADQPPSELLARPMCSYEMVELQQLQADQMYVCRVLLEDPEESSAYEWLQQVRHHIFELAFASMAGEPSSVQLMEMWRSRGRVEEASCVLRFKPGEAATRGSYIDGVLMAARVFDVEDELSQQWMQQMYANLLEDGALAEPQVTFVLLVRVACQALLLDAQHRCPTALAAMCVGLMVAALAQVCGTRDTDIARAGLTSTPSIPLYRILHHWAKCQCALLHVSYCVLVACDPDLCDVRQCFPFFKLAMPTILSVMAAAQPMIPSETEEQYAALFEQSCRVLVDSLNLSRFSPLFSATTCVSSRR